MNHYWKFLNQIVFALIGSQWWSFWDIQNKTKMDKKKKKWSFKKSLWQKTNKQNIQQQGNIY